MHDDFLPDDFRRLFFSYALSLFGSLLGAGIVGWLAVTTAGVSGTQLGLLLASSSSVAAIVGITVGSRIDGWQKKRVMICLDLAAAVAVLTLAVTVSTGHLTLLHLGIVSAVELSAGVLFTSASAPMLKTIAGSRLDWAAGRQESVFWLAQLLGPAVGGLLTSTIGAQWTLTGNALSFLVSAALITGIVTTGVPQEPSADADKSAKRASIADGARTIWRIPTLRLLYFNGMLFGISVMATSPVLTLFMLNDLHLAAWSLGLVLGLPCIGGVVAGFLSRRFLTRITPRRLLLSAGIARTFWLLPLAAIPAGGPAVILLIANQTLFLFCAGLFNPVYAATRIRVCPTHRLSAVVSTMGATSRITQPIGMLSAGVLVDAIGTRPTLIAAGTLCVVSGVLLLFVRTTNATPDPADVVPVLGADRAPDETADAMPKDAVENPVGNRAPTSSTRM